MIGRTNATKKSSAFDFSEATVDNANQVLKDKVCYGVGGEEYTGTLETGAEKEIEELLGFPELDSLAVNNNGYIITTVNPIYTRVVTGTDLTVTVTGGSAGTYLLNGSSADLGTAYSITSGANTRIEVSGNGKVTDYNTANGFTAFKIVFSGTAITNDEVKINDGDSYVTASSVVYAHLNYAGTVSGSALTITPSTSSNVGVYARQLIKSKLSSVTGINATAFRGCYSLQSITIPSGVTTIGNDAFNGCSLLTSITIPANVVSIGNYAFSGCSSLTSITIPSTVTSMGDQAFAFCDALKSITIPSSVSTFGTYMFSSCDTLKSITILPNVISLGQGTFQTCGSLTSINIPSGVTDIGDAAFRDCYSLTEILNTSALNLTYTAALTNLGLYNLAEWNFNNTKYNHSLSLSAGSATAVRNVKGKTAVVKFSPLSTFASTTAPQFRLANMTITKTQMIVIIEDLKLTGVTGKTLSFLGCTGSADFDSTERADWATYLDWTIIW